MWTRFRRLPKESVLKREVITSYQFGDRPGASEDSQEEQAGII